LSLSKLANGTLTPRFFDVCVLCGMGFTMSLFIGELVFAGRARRLKRS
jgi:Na+:H+ antiporter, NhaA family